MEAVLVGLVYVGVNQALVIAFMFKELREDGCWYEAQLGRNAMTVWRAAWVLPFAYLFLLLALLFVGFREVWK